MLTPALAGRYRGFLFWLGRQDWFNWLGPRLFTPIDTWLYPRAHGAVVSAGPPVLSLLMLTTRGRLSGQPRTVPLLYMRHGADVIVVGSNWARPHHPGWSENLLAYPACSLTIGRYTYPAHARLLATAEADALWPTLEAFCPVWRTYRERSGRDLRVFILRHEHPPRPGGATRTRAQESSLSGTHPRRRSSGSAISSVWNT